MNARMLVPGLVVASLVIVFWPGAIAESTPVKLTDPSTEPAFCRIDLGTTTQINDDTFYLSLDGDDDAIEVNDIRLTAFGSKGPGTVVTASDSSEIATADCQAMSVAYYDGIPNSRFGIGDYVYVGYNKATTQLVEGSAHSGDYWVRITPYASLGAGTIVFAGDQDLGAYGGGTALTNAEHAFWDKDGSGGFNAGDVAYITPKAVSTNNYVPVASARVVNATYAYGSLAAIGDSDVSLSLTDPSTDAAICRVDAGQAGAMDDDGFYLSMDGDDDAVEAFDLRLFPFGGKKAGTTVTSSDTLEIVAANCQAYATAYYDMNSNGAYNVGDVPLIGYDKTTSSLVQPATSDGDWWIRLNASGALAAGTLVYGGDADFVAKGAGAALTGAEFAYYDADGSTTFTTNDWAYLTASAVATDDRPPTASARLHGPVYAFGTLVTEGDKDGPYLAPSATTSSATSSTSSASSSMTNSSTSAKSSSSSSAAESSTSAKKGTPALGGLGIVVAVTATLVLVGRRRA